jgi:uncharacterized protein (TIGR00375 family)
LTPVNIDKWCRLKGVSLVATGDFTHPAWFGELKENLEESGNGFLQLKNSDGKVKFVLGAEVSCIYRQGDKTRRVHLCVFLPDFASVEKFNAELTDHGCNIRSDGRPILGLSAKEVLKILKSVNHRGVMIPAHAWTPWFAIFGSKSGFDSIEECFEELSGEIFAIETGLSSDPPMNWRLSALDKIALVSNSDAHSLPNIAREANVFDLDIDKVGYDEFFEAIKNKDKEKFLKTIEFYPEEGMYHVDGHRDCKVSFDPSETKKMKGVCPVCKKPLTIGVLYRVDQLADRPVGFVPNNAIPYISLVELDKIIAEAIGVKSRTSTKVQAEFNSLLQKGGNEFNILLNLSYEELAKMTLPEVVEGIKRVRERRLTVMPGFDGQYGKVTIFSDEERKAYQRRLF